MAAAPRLRQTICRTFLPLPDVSAPLPRTFFERDPLICAREMIGCELVWGECRGRIVETEAYAEFGDEACHAFTRKLARSFIADYPPGAAYVYQNYGIHWLLNVLVKGPLGNGFVLIRAIEPTEGLDVMRSRRRLEPIRQLCSGPGKLTVAFGIGRAEHGFDLCSDPARTFAARRNDTVVDVQADVRVGITKAADFPWRFVERGSPFLSVKVRPSSQP